MDPDPAAAADGQEQLPEHDTVAVPIAVAGATPEASEYVPAKQLVQLEVPANEYVPALQSMHVDDESAPTADEYLPATPRQRPINNIISLTVSSPTAPSDAGACHPMAPC
jgi:hypothetical protein